MMKPNAGDSEMMKYRGVRKRKWGKWVSEVRLPNSRDRIWLGSYDSSEKAARAFDAAAFCLRGRKARLNFPSNLPQIPAARSLTHQQIQEAAARHAHSIPEEEVMTTTTTTTAVADSPETSEATTVEATMDWSFLESMTEGFPLIDEFCYDFMAPATTGLTEGAAEDGGNGFGTNSFLWNF